MAWQIPNDYYSLIAKIESGNNPNAKNSKSTASGLYQFTRSTWEGLGYAWSDVFNVNKQNQAIQTFTSNNARGLSSAGIEVNNASLYAAHFLGLGGARKVFAADDTDTLASVVGQNVINANPTLSGYSVGQFKGWLGEKTGSASALGSVLASIGAFEIGGVPLWENPTLTEGGAASGIIGWLQNFFSINTASRVIAVIVGIALIIVAIVVLASSNETVQSIAKTALPIPK